MKRTLTAGLLLLLGLSVSAKPRIVATASMIADIARNIAGPHADIATIVPIGGDPHIHEPTPRDASLAAGADLIFRNGLTFEGWLDELIENSGTKATIVTVTDGVEPIRSLQYKNAVDPHAWMDASNGLRYAENILKACQSLMPEFAVEFEENFRSYRDAVMALDAYIRDRILEIPEENRILITSHDAFQYYGRRYGLRLESVLGTSTDADVQTSDLARLNTVIRSSTVPAVFVESTINPRLLNQIAEDNGIRIGGKLYADSLGETDGPAGTYLGMLRYNTDTIVEALKQSRQPNTEHPASRSKQFLLFGTLGGIVILTVLYLLIRKSF